MSRFEDILQSIIDGGDPSALQPPASRNEVLLQAVHAKMTANEAIIAGHTSQLADFANPPSVRVYNSANISIANITDTPLAFDAETFDTDAMHDVSTNPSRITCKHAGLYHILGQIEFAAAANGIRSAYIKLNGATVISRFMQLPDASVPTRLNISALYKLAVNDYIELYVYQSSTVSLNVTRGADYSPIFSAVKVGA